MNTKCEPFLKVNFLRLAYVRNHTNGLLAYPCICASGCNASYLHYITNSDTIADNTMILNDMGGKWRGYCADVTCSYPVNGVFTE